MEYGESGAEAPEVQQAAGRNESSVEASPGVFRAITPKPPAAFGFTMSNQNDTWFKRKPYPHFSSKISTKDEKWLLPYLQSPEKIAAHAFFPFILRKVLTRRFRKPKTTPPGVARRSLQRMRLPDKPRPIHYATHIDSHIYAFYANSLNQEYEKVLRQEPGLSECIMAYRRVASPYKPGRNKCNIEFAFETFEKIKRREENCIVLTFDIKSFFDTLRHDLLKRAWCDLLETCTLPKDHYNIFKAITKYRYVQEFDILKTLNLRENDLREWKKDKLFTTEEFKQIITGLLPVTRHEQEQEGKFKGKGIPQGTPISAFLSNLYMLEFDRFMYGLIVQRHNGIYRRYPDDIIVVLLGDAAAADAVEELVNKKITDDLKLELQPDKTECFFFTRSGDGLKVEGNKPLTYLGFEFDGDRVLVKGASLAKYYRSLKQMVKYAARRASSRKPVAKHQALTIFRNRVYRHSHLFARNYVAYVSRADQAAETILGDTRGLIRKQVRNHWKVIHRELLKREVHVKRMH